MIAKDNNMDVPSPVDMEADTKALDDVEVDMCSDWRKQLTFRGCLLGTLIGFGLCFISLKLSLTTGVIPSLNIVSGMLGFVGMRSLIGVVTRWFTVSLEFTKQENTVIQTFAVALYSCAFILGFGSYYIAMDETSWASTGSIESQKSEIVNPVYSQILAYAFCVVFTGIFLLIVMRKTFIVDLDLTFPSGTATATMINSFFTEAGQDLARRQFKSFTRWFGLSFGWDFFSWFFAGGSDCGFSAFPTFGLKAADMTWNFNFTFNYVAVGMLVPHIVNYSMMVGSIVSWGILWPIIIGKEGEWYAEGTPQSSLQGLLGYKVFIAISLILGDGMYQLFKLGYVMIKEYRRRKNNSTQIAVEESSEDARERMLRRRVFEAGTLPWWLSPVGFICSAVLGSAVIPHIFPGTKWYIILVAYLITPFFAVPNAYMTGLSDWDMSSTFGKLALFVFASWSSAVEPDTGIIAGLATCGVVLCATSQASTLMQDFKTGYLTRSSPKAMFYAQILGTFAGAILSPLAFLVFYSAFNIGDPNGPYPAPYGQIYRSMAILGTEGFAALPSHCLELCGIFFAISIVFSALRDFVPWKFGEESKVSKWSSVLIPIPMVMSIPFYIGAWLAISMGIGSIVKLVWEHKNKKSFDDMHIPVASGVIAGDGIWSLPSAILALAGLNPPICMSFAAAA